MAVISYLVDTRERLDDLHLIQTASIVLTEVV